MIPLVPTPSSLAARVLPGGVPGLRKELYARTGLFASALDPDATPGDPGLFGPGSPTWEVVGQPAQALAGLRAALLQALAAPVITATDHTGTFASDFAGRVARTGAFVQRQNLGSMEEVFRSARRVRAMHRAVKGTSAEGVEFDASDPHLQTWVSMTLTDSFLVMAERYGGVRLSPARANQFVREQSTHGALLDPRVDLEGIFSDPDQRAALQAGELPLPLIEEGRLPTTLVGLRARMAAWTDELRVTPRTRKLLDLTLRLEGAPPAAKAAARPLLLATLATIPDDWHELLAPEQSRVEEHLAAQAVQTPLALFQLLFGRTPAVDAAYARVTRR